MSLPKLNFPNLRLILSFEWLSIGIKSASEAMSEVAEFLNAPKIKLPKHLHRLEENMRGGIKSTGAIVNIIGHTIINTVYF